MEPAATKSPAALAVYSTSLIPGQNKPHSGTATGASTDIVRVKADRLNKSAKRVERPQGGPKGERSE
jgi:hypothetical protein